MSLRTVTRVALVGLLSLAFAAPVAAQDRQTPFVNPRTGSFMLTESYNTDPPVELAPMPRLAAKHGEIHFGVQIGGSRVIQVKYEVKLFDTAALAPMPREKNAMKDELGIEVGIGILRLGHDVAGFDYTPSAAAAAQPLATPVQTRDGWFIDEVLPGKVVSRPAVRVGEPCCAAARLGESGYGQVCCPYAESTNPMLALGRFRRDDNGTWWVVVIRVPQPKFAPAPPQLGVSDIEVIEETIARAHRQEYCPHADSAYSNRGCVAWEMAGAVATSPAVTPAAISPFAGTWVRKIGNFAIAADIAVGGKEMTLRMMQFTEEGNIDLTITTECTITAEGLVHGVITGVDAEVNHNHELPVAPPLANEYPDAQLVMALQELVDCPFSFRVKQTSAGLMVSNLKIATTEGLDGAELAIFCGMFKRGKDSAVPAVKPMRTRVSGMTRPSPRYLQHYPQYFPDDPLLPLPRELATEDILDKAEALRARGAQLAPPPRVCGTPTSCGTPPMTACPPAISAPQAGLNPPKPANVPANEFGMMVEVFGQMVDAKQPPRSVPPPPPPPPPVAVQTLGYVMPQVPEGSCPPCPLPTSTRPSITGTWVRQMGPQLCVVKIAPDHLTMSVMMCAENDEGEPIRAGWVITGDYHLSRDGTTLVGLLTGADIQIEGNLPVDDTATLLKPVAKLQQALCDKPFAMSVRVYGESLVIGNVRMPEVEDDSIFDAPAAVLIAGQYKNHGDKPLPKAKAKNEVPRFVPPAPTGNMLTPGVMPSSAPRVSEPPLPMATPTPPAIDAPVREAAKPRLATEMTVLWKDGIEYHPDPTRNGEKVPGLSGQLFLFGPNMDPAPAAGTVTIWLLDDSPRPAGIPGAESERWVIDADSLRRAAEVDERFGACYALFLPWQSRRADVTRVRLTANFSPDDGLTLYAPETKLTLRPPVKLLKLKPPPAQPFLLPMSTDAPKTKKEKQKAKTDEERMKSLLYQSETSGPIGQPPRHDTRGQSDDLRQIKNEWRRFWFGEKPCHATPERVHGGIY